MVGFLEKLENGEELDQDDIIEAIAKFRSDYPFYAPRILKIQTMSGNLERFDLNTPQILLDNIVSEVKRKRLLRVLILKGRRMGVSTYWSGRFFRNTSMNYNRYAVQITHEPDATEFLFGMVKRYYNFCPEALRPETLYNNKKLLEFNTKNGKGLNSAFRVGTAGKEDFGSGQLIHYAHFSEVAKWPSETAESLLTSVLQCVPKKPFTEIVFESTAKGIGGEFYDRFWSARYRYFVTKLDGAGLPVLEESVNSNSEAENVYTSIFLPWFIFPDYQVPPPANFKLTAKEVELKKKHNLTNGHLFWRRLTITNDCNNSPDIFQQEYPSTPEEAFLGSGSPVFDNIKLSALRDSLPAPKARYECIISTGDWRHDIEGRLRVWEEPRTGRSYIIPADVSEGITGGDYHCADVIDHVTGNQVAQWHGRCPTYEFEAILLALGRRYNTALLAVERNNHGYSVNENICSAEYPRIYVEMVPEPPGKPRKRYGWVTSNATRPKIIDNLIREVLEDSHGIRCRETLSEMMSFQRQDNGRMEADPGKFDDRVISIAIGKYLRQRIDLPDEGPSQNVDTGEAKTRRKSSRGWT